jgi:triosephosphate isomerase
VGETLDEREQGGTDEKVRGQVESAFDGLSADDVAKCIVAYEPIWAIGTGRNATPDDANATIKVIRDHVRKRVGADVADGLRILYGGSVKPGNISDLMAMPEIDGGLVGGASLDPDEFARVIRYGLT